MLCLCMAPRPVPWLSHAAAILCYAFAKPSSASAALFFSLPQPFLATLCPCDAYRLNAYAVLLKSTPLRIDAMP